VPKKEFFLFKYGKIEEKVVLLGVKKFSEGENNV
jgi:hypothetical protein